MPLAPEAGAVNVTVTPLTGDPPAITVAVSGVAKAVSSAVLCGVPPVAVTVSTIRFVRSKFAGVATPEAVAVTT